VIAHLCRVLLMPTSRPSGNAVGPKVELGVRMLKHLRVLPLFVVLALSACGVSGVPAESLAVTVRHDGVEQVVNVEFPFQDGKTTTTCGFADCVFARAIVGAPLKGAFRSVPYTRDVGGVDPDLSAAHYDLVLDDALGGREVRVDAFDQPIRVNDTVTITVSRQ
jgi:hypothetical protein